MVKKFIQLSDDISNLVLNTGYVGVGTNLPTSGDYRLGNNDNIVWRNAANSANIQGLIVTGANVIQMGDGTNASACFYDCTNIHRLRIASTDQLTVTSSTVDAQNNNILTTGYVGVGSNLPTTGNIRLPYDGTVNMRNSSNTADVQALIVTGSNIVQVGHGTLASAVYLDGTGTHRIRVGGTDQVTISGTAVNCQDNNILTTGHIGLGTTLPTTGDIRLQNNDNIVWRNAANTANIQGIIVTGADVVQVGDGTNASAVFLDAANIHRLRTGGVDQMTVNSSTVDCKDNNILTTGFIDTSGGTVTSGTIRIGNDQKITSENNAGGDSNLLSMNTADQVLLGSNSANQTDVKVIVPTGENIVLQFASTNEFIFSQTQAQFERQLDMQANPVIDVSHLEVGDGTAPSQGDIRIGHTAPSIYTMDDSASTDYHLISRSSDGYNTTLLGDGSERLKVNSDSIFISDTSAPTDTPVSGGYMYSESGAGKWKGSSGTITTFGTAEPHCKTCNRDFALEWRSDKYGYLAVCMWCLSEGRTADEYVIGKSEVA